MSYTKSWDFFFFFYPTPITVTLKAFRHGIPASLFVVLMHFGFKQCQECAKLTMQPPIAPFISQKNAVVTFPEKAISFG